MAQILFSNFATSTLASPLGSGDTSITLAAGGGSLFPSPSGGDYYALTLTDAATGLNHEVVYVYGRSGDLLDPVVRAQEGTTAQAWVTGDTAQNNHTAGVMGDMAQKSQVQGGALVYALDTGAANAYVGTLSPAITTYALGQDFLLKAAHANNGASTVNFNGIGAVAVKRINGADLQPGDILAGQILHLIYNGTYFSLQNPAGKLSEFVNCLQFRLTMSAGNLKLMPFNGNQITVSGLPFAIPDTGVTLSSAGAAGSTTYYIYAYDNAGTLTLERSTTGYTTSNGIKVKSGDATRTLVGMARTDSGSAWSLFRSWINDPGYVAANPLIANKSRSSGTYAEVDSALQTGFLVWASEQVNVYANGRMENVQCSIGFDGTTAEDVSSSSTQYSDSNATSALAISYASIGLSEGYHYATLLFRSLNGTGSVYGSATSGQRSNIQVAIGGR